MLGRDVRVADGCEEAVDVGVAQVAGDGGQALGGHQPMQRETLLAQVLGDRILALLDRLLTPFLGEPLADLVAGARALDEREPVPRRSGAVGLRGEDLDRVAVLQDRVQRGQTSVDAATNAVVPDLGVHGIRKIDGSRPRWE